MAQCGQLVEQIFGKCRIEKMDAGVSDRPGQQTPGRGPSRGRTSGRFVDQQIAIHANGSLSVDRATAFDLLSQYVKNPSLINHMKAVEAAMRAYARKHGQDEEKWGIVGLLHDFDYERWPDPPNHPLKGSEILREKGYPEDVIYAIKSHADYLTDCP